MASGRCTVAVTAIVGAETILAELALELTVSDDAEPTAGPSATPKPRTTPGKRPSGGAKATATPSKYGSVTPGKALLSSHASGSGVLAGMSSGQLRLSRIDGQITLMLGGEPLELTCGETAFRMKRTDEILELTAETDSPDWRLTLQTLETLADNGVRVLALVSSDGQRRLNTRQLLTGAAYIRERTGGFVPRDFIYRWTGEGWRVEVEDRLYALLRGKLVQLED